jgi:hypothetical protein
MKKRSVIISRRIVLPILFGIKLGLGTGCGSVEVDPFLDSDLYFSIYGSFDMDFLVQHLRVIPIDTLIGAVDDSLDARVTTTDLSTGQVWMWHDSLFTFDNGSIGHVFTSRFRIQAGRTYRTEVERSDGAVTWAETTVPQQPSAVLGETNIVSPPGWSFPLGTQEVIWDGVLREPHRVDVYYRFKEQDDEPFIDIGIPYDTARSSEVTPRGWEITVQYTDDYEFLKREYIHYNPWRLVGVLMRVQVVTEDWMPPGGLWDQEVLSQPGTFSNVHNGFGYIGSAGRFSVEWLP